MQHRLSLSLPISCIQSHASVQAQLEARANAIETLPAEEVLRRLVQKGSGYMGGLNREHQSWSWEVVVVAMVAVVVVVVVAGYLLFCLMLVLVLVLVIFVVFVVFVGGGVCRVCVWNFVDALRSEILDCISSPFAVAPNGFDIMRVYDDYCTAFVFIYREFWFGALFATGVSNILLFGAACLSLLSLCTTHHGGGLFFTACLVPSLVCLPSCACR